MTALRTPSGVALAPADPATTHAGRPVQRVGLWPADGRPVVLDVDEIALAIAHHGELPGRYGFLINCTAVNALRGVDDVGRGTLALLAERWRDGDPDVWPPGKYVRHRCTQAADQLCRRVHCA